VIVEEIQRRINGYELLGMNIKHGRTYHQIQGQPHVCPQSFFLRAQGCGVNLQ